MLQVLLIRSNFLEFIIDLLMRSVIFIFVDIENSNLYLQGNYKGFGDTKIVPDVLPEMFEKIVTASKAWSEDEEAMQAIWSAIKGPMV